MFSFFFFFFFFRGSKQMPIETPDIGLREENLFPHKFLPILVNYDPLALLTSTSTSKPPYFNALLESSERPQSVHQYSFVDHKDRSPSNKPTRSRPKPPQIILSSMHQSTKATPPSTTTTHRPVDWFAPTTKFHSTPPKQPSDQHNSHRKPFKLDNSDIGWDVKFNISDELRELLRLEKIKLQNISETIGTNPKWFVTSSRSKHRDKDVFVARANNPFGHSTKWKLRYIVIFWSTEKRKRIPCKKATIKLSRKPKLNAKSGAARNYVTSHAITTTRNFSRARE